MSGALEAEVERLHRFSHNCRPGKRELAVADRILRRPLHRQIPIKNASHARANSSGLRQLMHRQLRGMNRKGNRSLRAVRPFLQSGAQVEGEPAARREVQFAVLERRLVLTGAYGGAQEDGWRCPAVAGRERQVGR